MERRRDSGRQLEPPAAFRAPRSTGPRGLIPPSHFQSRSAPPLAVPADVPWGSAALSHWEVEELKRENERLKDELHKWATKGERTQETGSKTRFVDGETEPAVVCHTLAISQQAEIISHQLHEIQRLEAELAALRVAAGQQEAMAAHREKTLSSLQEELVALRNESQAKAEALRSELEEARRSGRGEAEALREQLEELRRRSLLEADSLKEEIKMTKEMHAREIGLARGELQKVLEDAEATRKRQEERAQEGLRATIREHQAELSRLSEVHAGEVTSLKQQICELRQDLDVEHKEAVQLREERDALQNQLSVAEAELASQNALVLRLKTYVGEQESRQPSSEQEQLRTQIQYLEDERDALKITAELLQVRLASLSDILTLQETELSKKVQLQDPLQPESSQKLQGLLTRWREKVFTLLVQLKSQELGHRDNTKLLGWKVKELEEAVESKDQKVALLLHSLEDKTAEVNMEQVRNKTLQAEALRASEAAQNLQRRAEAVENAFRGLGEFATRASQQFLEQEEVWKAAFSRLAGLGNRVSFAAKRVDTIHVIWKLSRGNWTSREIEKFCYSSKQLHQSEERLVCQKMALARLHQEEKVCTSRSEQERVQPPYEDLQDELQRLHEERDQLSLELKRGAQLIEKKVTEARERVEADLQEMKERSRNLQEALEAKGLLEEDLRRQQEDTERQLEAARQDLQRSEEVADGLRQELQHLREEYERALQEKVAAIETQLHKDLSEMEKCLNDARREQTKAVVALRQAERQAARDKARSEELAKLQESATQQEIARLERRAQELEKDKNLLMATLRQEGLLAQHKKNRRAAIQGLAEPTGKSEAKPASKESLIAVLDNLQVLGAAILDEEDVDKDRSTSTDA